MSLPKIGSVLQSKHHRTGRWEFRYVVLGSKKPVVFLFNRDGRVLLESIDRIVLSIEYGDLRVMVDE